MYIACEGGNEINFGMQGCKVAVSKGHSRLATHPPIGPCMMYSNCTCMSSVLMPL